MQKKSIIIAFIVVLGISLALYGLSFTDSRTTTDLKRCLFEAPIKCGRIEMTDEKILQEIYDLGLSKKEASKLFLKAQKENLEYFALYSNKGEENLTSEEQRMKVDHERSIPYFERALRIVEKMSD